MIYNRPLMVAAGVRTDGGGGHELLPQVVVTHEVRRATGRLQQVQLEVVEAVRPAAAEAAHTSATDYHVVTLLQQSRSTAQFHR